MSSSLPRLVSVGGSPSIHLSLPAHGMPEILAFSPLGLDEAPDFPVERASRVNGMDRAVPSAVLLPTGGMGFFGWPAIAGHRDGQDFIAQFTEWGAGGDAQDRALSAHDRVAGLSITIKITAHPGGPIAMAVLLVNEGASVYTLDRCMAGTVIIDAGPATLTTLTGMWGREFTLARKSSARDSGCRRTGAAARRTTGSRPLHQCGRCHDRRPSRLERQSRRRH
jgi:alpha-galactosidase